MTQEEEQFEKEWKEFVDLGLPSGTLWAEKNEEGYFTYDEAMKLFNKESCLNNI